MVAASHRAVEWISFGSNAFNAFVPFYANIEHTPEYISNTTSLVTTESFYWANRQIGALADASFDVSSPHIARYQRTVWAKGREIMKHRSPERTKLFTKKVEYLPVILRKFGTYSSLCINQKTRLFRSGKGAFFTRGIRGSLTSGLCGSTKAMLANTIPFF